MQALLAKIFTLPTHEQRVVAYKALQAQIIAAIAAKVQG